MSFLQDIFGYPTDRLTPIRSHAQKEADVWKMYGEYRQGKNYYIYEITSSGSTIEEWFTDASELQVAYLKKRQSGTLSKFFHFPTPLVRSKRSGYMHCILIEQPSQQQDDNGRNYSKRSQISFHLWTYKNINAVDEELAIQEGLEFLQLTCEQLAQLLIDKSSQRH